MDESRPPVRARTSLDRDSFHRHLGQPLHARLFDQPAWLRAASKVRVVRTNAPPVCLQPTAKCIEVSFSAFHDLLVVAVAGIPECAILRYAVDIPDLSPAIQKCIRRCGE